VGEGQREARGEGELAAGCGCLLEARSRVECVCVCVVAWHGVRAGAARFELSPSWARARTGRRARASSRGWYGNFTLLQLDWLDSTTGHGGWVWPYLFPRLEAGVGLSAVPAGGLGFWRVGVWFVWFFN
jgi:hypothetical protein